MPFILIMPRIVSKKEVSNMKKLILVLLVIPCLSQAEVQIGGGNSRAGDVLTTCETVGSMIVRRWTEVKQIMLPPNEKIKRPNSADFVCADRYQVTSFGVERMMVNSDMRCFTDPAAQGRGACCDKRLSACVQLSWEKLPETLAKVQERRNKGFKRSKSEWVTPPSENDQWAPASK